MSYADTFDTTHAITTMFLWLTFNYVDPILNCDLQRILVNSDLAKHVLGIIAFYFLFTTIETSKKSSIAQMWLKTVTTYSIIMMMTKARWFFVVPALAIMLIDQSVHREAIHLHSISLEHLRFWLWVSAAALVIIGVIHYAYVQSKEKGADFSWYTFFFKTGGCRGIASPVTTTEDEKEVAQ